MYVLVETYIRERDEQNPYDYIYSLDDEAEAAYDRSLETCRESRQGARAGQRASSRAVSIESFYADEIDDDETAGDGPIETYYVHDRAMSGKYGARK